MTLIPRGGFSGQGVKPSVSTITTVGRGRSATAPAMPSPSQLQRAQPQLQAALHGRAVVALMALHGVSAVDAEVTMSPQDGPRSLSRRDGTVHAELPFAWVVDVWARGLATSFGRFCLAASSSTGRRWTLTTVGPDLGTPETIVVTLPAGRH